MFKFFSRLWNGETENVTTAALIVGAASLASRIVGVLRDRVLASTFGAGNTLDAYYAAFRVPDFLYNLVVLGALSAAFIPVFTEYLQTKERGEAWRLAERVLSVIGAVMGAACLVLFIFAPVLIPLIVPGFTGEKLALTISLSRVMFLSTFFLALSAVMGGVLQATRRFVAFSLAPVFYNIGIIAGVVLFVPNMGPVGLGWGVVLGAFLHLVTQASVAFKLGLERLPFPSFNYPGVRQILKLMAPRTAGLAVTQVNLIIILAIASTLSAGSVSVINLANNLQSVALGLIGVSFAVAAFPALSSAAASGDKKRFRDVLGSVSRKIIFLVVPATAAFLIFRAQIVRLVLGDGLFDWDDTIRTANVLAILASSLVAQCLVLLLARAYYALQNTWTPLWTGIATEVTTFTLAMLLKDQYGVLGLAAATAISSWVGVFLMWAFLRARQGGLGTREVWHSLLRTLAATLAFCAVAVPVRIWVGTVFDLDTFWEVALQIGAAGTAGTVAFIIMAMLLKSSELMEFREAAARRLWKKASVTEGVERAQGM
jgi:putative peptidoglycan lipid II flippase